MGSGGFHVPLCSVCHVLCAPRIKTNLFEPLYQKSGRTAPGPNRSYAEIKMRWILKNVCAQKRLFNQRAAIISAVCFVVNLSPVQPIEGVTAREWLTFYWIEESSRWIRLGSAWLSVKFKLASCFRENSSIHMTSSSSESKWDLLLWICAIVSVGVRHWETEFVLLSCSRVVRTSPPEMVWFNKSRFPS